MTDPVPSATPASDPSPEPRRAPEAPACPEFDRSRLARLWYRFARGVFSGLMSLTFGWRATGQDNMPDSGGVLLVANHLSFLDVILLGASVRRPLNFVARSTLFIPLLGAFLRSVGTFPIQREGMGASGLKETLRRLRNGGIVLLFPEGTRSTDGELAELKPGIAVLVARGKVPVVPAGIAGTFEALPRSRRFPRPHRLRIHFGPPILQEELKGMDSPTATALIRDRIAACIAVAREGLEHDMARR